VPTQEVERWEELDPDLAGHLMQIGQTVARTLSVLFSPKRVALLISGCDVPHTFLNLIPIDQDSDLLVNKAVLRYSFACFLLQSLFELLTHSIFFLCINSPVNILELKDQAKTICAHLRSQGVEGVEEPEEDLKMFY
jgi:hypothetical protein